MTAETEDRAAAGAQHRAVYVYGILPGDIDVMSDATGVGDPPGRIRAVKFRDLAALVSDIDPTAPLGRPEDLLAHEELLDASAADVPVLPLRFGAVVTSDEAVTDELLSPHYEEFAAALQQLEGHTEYVVKGRYVEDAVLGEVLEENPRAAELSEQIRGADPDATRDLRIELGQLMAEAVEAKRGEDTRALGDALAGHVTSSMVRPPSHELDAVHLAVLVETSAAGDLRETVEGLARDWGDRIELRLLGPLAAYDFVGALAPEG